MFPRTGMRQQWIWFHRRAKKQQKRIPQPSSFKMRVWKVVYNSGLVRVIFHMLLRDVFLIIVFVKCYSNTLWGVLLKTIWPLKKFLELKFRALAFRQLFLRTNDSLTRIAPSFKVKNIHFLKKKSCKWVSTWDSQDMLQFCLLQRTCCNECPGKPEFSLHNFYQTSQLKFLSQEIFSSN